ncbi:scm-like with four MBT domains protein 1 [Anabrus simplex]|uniref:scm-like with four MBT domains protein 1 n=1 Tax=Anabrus simplex TaxID=316456 RepID=UPI0035A3B863
MDANCDLKNGDGDDNFIWQDYLDVTNTVEVPHVLFSHVEQSLQSGLKEGMILEVPHKLNSNNYWVASIVMTCGPLLRLRYVGFEDNRQDFWCDLTKINVHPIGWCKEQGLPLEFPPELQDKVSNSDAVLEKTIQNAQSIPPELLTGDGFTPVDRIKQGMKLEVQDKLDPRQLWVATIIENVGGRLLLRYDTPDSTSPDFWLFYTSPRLFRMGTVAERGFPWMLVWPNYMKTHHGPEEWDAVMEMAKEDARRVPLPPDLFQNSPPKRMHHFEEGMKLEAVHPHNMVEICPASVVKVYDEHYFLVQIDSYSSMEKDHIESTWLCTAEHPYIFPVGWAVDHELQLTHPRGWTTIKEEFDWAEYLEVTNTMPAPHSCFPEHPSAKELGFLPDMKLEAVNPENQHQICAASIVKLIDHLLWVHLDSNDGFHPSHIVSTSSTDIYPVGWCESNSYPLKPPRFYQTPAKPEPENTDIPENKENGNSSQQRSFWCPKIYFNHKCFSGPFLSKSKLAQLPKAVGPGPVTLVMREVLTMLISVAYKSSRVLKELQADGKPEAGLHLEVLKAKYKNNTYRASVAVVTSADQVADFCKGICARLQVCPYMFGPTSVSENSCPENCNTLSKTKFTQYWVPGKRKIGRPKGEASNLIPRPKKKRGRKRLIGFGKPGTESDNVGTSDHQAECGEELSGDQRHCSSESSSPVAAKRKLIQKDIPKSGVKTRGAKLPNFALQMRAGHWPHKDILPSSTTRSQNNRADSPQAQKSGPPEKQSKISNNISAQTDKDSTRNEKVDIELESNPIYWSEDDVYRYLMSSSECRCAAQICKEELIDGQALMMLNLPTVRNHLKLKVGLAVKLCTLIENLRLAYFCQYVAGENLE